MSSWRVAKSLTTLLAQVNEKYPGRDKSNDGTIGDDRHASTTSDHNPNAAGVVTAMDISNDPAHGLTSRKLAEALIASRDKRIKYVISNRQINNSTVSPWIWRPYNGSNPHDHHMHLSVSSNPALYDDTSPWKLDSAPGPVVVHDSHRFMNITATEFGGSNDINTSAYDNHTISDVELGVALPFHFKGLRPRVTVYKDGKSVICNIVDIGPWNTNDPYWTTNQRPQAETGHDLSGRHTNQAGIDLTPAAAKKIGLQGKGLVDWEFVATTPLVAEKPVITTTTETPIAGFWTRLWAVLQILFTRKAT